MIRKARKNVLWLVGILCVAALVLALSPARVLAQDTDKDGLDNTLEEGGFYLSAGLELWGGGGTFVSPTDPNVPDLFVIVRLADFSNLDPTRIEDYFQFITKPVADGGLGFKVWVLEETNPDPNVVPNRHITAGSDQMAVLLVESLDTNGTSQGISQYGTIMTEGKGGATLFSQRVVDAIDSACAQNQCKDVSGVSGVDLKFRHLSWVMAHEVMHVLYELDNSLRKIEGHHITRGTYVMEPAVVYTEKKGKVTYYIPDDFSSTAQNNWLFY